VREPAVDTTSVSDGFGDDTADMPDVGKKLGGRWRTLGRLGTGGMGTVYEALSDDGRRVAVKLLEPLSADGERVSITSATRERFLREASAAKAIDSENVVRTFELGVDEALGRPFLVMELLEGRDLASVLADQAPLAPSVVARIGVGAARGLSAAHAASIVHRDVKPSNVFLHRAGGELVVKVCDFGIAKTVGEIGAERASLELTRTGGFLGSPRYMSPEQAKSARSVDHRSDVWSLCVTLYESLTGVELWAGRASLGEVIVAICTEAIEPLAKLAPWVDAGLARVVERGLERDPERRWQSMDALASELQRWSGERTSLLESDLIRFDPPRVSRFRRRRRELVIGGAVVLLAGGVALALAVRRAPDAVAEQPAAEPAPSLAVALEEPTPAGPPEPARNAIDAGAALQRPARAARRAALSAKPPVAPAPPPTAALPAEPRSSATASSPMLTPKDDW
jgi:hypothetical protein